MSAIMLQSKSVVNIDPRTKLVVFVLINIMMMGSKPVMVEVLLAGISCLLLLNGQMIQETLLYGGLFFLLLAVDSGYGLQVSTPVGQGLIIADRMIRLFLPMVMCFTVLMKNTTVSEFIAAFQKAHLPMGFIIPFAVMVRFVPTVKEEYRAIVQAMSYRGIPMGVKAVLFKPFMTLEYVMVPLLISSAGVMDELAAAAMTRGLDRDSVRSNLADVKLRLPDYGLMAGVIIIFILMKKGWLG
ncbi:hypothetical protein AKG39_18685 [Acetobacterium bakii]|uniref:Transporter n=2 Tax=Acetobacterium bakii TaxID=52689 RepID=A0A0L6TVE0_9FIRM|nr:hypothetical protein AKG39_18685 [Acetobacterium bakii]